MDTYYLNNAVYLLEDYLKTTNSPAWAGSITYGPRQPHCWVGPFSLDGAPQDDGAVRRGDGAARRGPAVVAGVARATSTDIAVRTYNLSEMTESYAPRRLLGSPPASWPASCRWRFACAPGASSRAREATRPSGPSTSGRDRRPSSSIPALPAEPRARRPRRHGRRREFVADPFMLQKRLPLVSLLRGHGIPSPDGIDRRGHELRRRPDLAYDRRSFCASHFTFPIPMSSSADRTSTWCPRVVRGGIRAPVPRGPLSVRMGAREDAPVGPAFVDSSLFQYRDRWWMFTSTPENNKLLLYFADALEGPWSVHPASPIVAAGIRTSRARAAGSWSMDDRILRFAQDDAPKYGIQVFAFDVTQLDATTYREVPAGDRPVVARPDPDGTATGCTRWTPTCWRPNRWIASVDGKECSRNSCWPPGQPGVVRYRAAMRLSAASTVARTRRSRSSRRVRWLVMLTRIDRTPRIRVVEGTATPDS